MYLSHSLRAGPALATSLFTAAQSAAAATAFTGRQALATAAGGSSAGAKAAGDNQFDTQLLPFLVCPLAKTPLRFDPSTMELINDDLGVAYPIRGGIPRLVPTEGRLINAEPNSSSGSSGGSGAGLQGAAGNIPSKAGTQ